MTTSEVSKSPQIFRCGTLEYTKRMLMMMFFWLLWGDFCFMLMEQVHPTVLPLMLKSLGASNFIISLYVTTAISAISFVVNPIISFKSDRHRSRLGRRRPFLLVTTPIVGLFLILTGLSKEIGIWMHKLAFSHSQVTANLVTIGVIGILVLGYQLFHILNSSVYYYLFNDVVPEEFLGRFLAAFRVVAACSAAAFQFFVYKYAETHGREIFIIFGLIYLVGFLTMGIFVKEGEYPPPPENVDGKNGFMASIKTFFKESFMTNSFYWKFYAVESCMMVSLCTQVFNVFWFRSMGMTLDQFGKIMGITQIISMVLLIPAGMMSDKKHPVRVILLGVSIMAICTPFGFIFLNTHLSPRTIQIFSIAYLAVQIPGMVLYMASQMPLFMRILPQDRYGQFCSANSMVRSIAVIAGSALCGFLLDKLKLIFPAHDYYYRFIPFWVLFFQILTIIAVWQLYKAWKELGGDESYKPPLVGKELEDLTSPAESVSVH